MSLRFRYRAATAEGQLVDGVLDAPSRQGLLDSLRQRHLYPVAVDEVTPTQARRRRRRLPRAAAVAVWARNFATLVAATVPVDRALGLTADETPHQGLAAAVRALRRAVQEGGGMADAMQRHPAYFPPVACAMVAAGEASGALDTVLGQLADYLEETAELRAQVRTALLYPALMAVVASIGVAVLLLFVVPRFSAILEDVGGTLPLSTRLLVWASTALTSAWWLWLLVIGAAAYVANEVHDRPDLRRRWHDARLSWPILGELELSYVTARFTRTLGMLLASGAAPLAALRIARAAVPNAVIGEQLDRAIGEVAEGVAIAPALAGTLAPLAVQMLAAGEESGRLEEMCGRAAAMHDADVRRTLKSAIALIEPAMILIFGVLVGFVALAMLQAIYSINTTAF